MNRNIIINNEHDKICLLEKILHEYVLQDKDYKEECINLNSKDVLTISKLETIVSNFIDNLIYNKRSNECEYIKEIKYYINDSVKLKLIIDICYSIANETYFIYSE